jgi:membrane dipeptidase
MARRLTLLAGVACVSLILELPARGADVVRSPPEVMDLWVHLPKQVGRGRALDYGTGRADAARLRRGGVTGIVMPLGESDGAAAAARTETAYLTLQRWLVLSRADFSRGCTTKGGRIRTWLALPNGGRVAAQPSEIGVWTARGVRLFGLGARRSPSGTSAQPGHQPGGLSDPQQKFVAAVHDAAALVDVSEASPAVIEAVVRLARQSGSAVVASHSNARAVADHPYNLDDAQIKGIASTGGVIGVNFERRMLAPGREARLEHVVRQIRHLVRVAGVEHVAIGSGFESDARPPRELMNAARFPRLARALEESGLSRTDVEKVFSRNALRVLCPTGRRPDA